MPRPGRAWYHVTFSTYGTWLPGDPRGWRSRDHRTHSSGHHRSPPPPGEHSGLHRYSSTLSERTQRIPPHLAATIGSAMCRHLADRGWKVLSMCLSANHAHIQCELPTDADEAKVIIGKCKRTGSLAAGKALPGRLWARGCGLKSIRDREHQQRVFAYIVAHKRQSAWVWRFDEGHG